MAESRGRRARVARTMGRPRRNGAQVLTVGELRAALPERRRRRGSDNAPMGSSGLRDLLESLSEGPRRSRGGRRTSPLGRGEIESIEVGVTLPERTRRPPQLTPRQRRIRARRRKERAEAREARAARRSGRAERPREEVVEIDMPVMTVTAPRPHVARRPMGGRRRRRG